MKKISTPTPASNKTYDKLFNSIADVYDTAMKDVAGAVDAILKKAYWEIGKIIVENEQKGDLHAAYGDHLLEKISEDFTQSGRKGFSVTNLRNMRQVYGTFPIHQLTDELTWTHFVELSSIKDKKDRQAYTKKAIEKKWTVEELQQTLYQDQVKTILLEDQTQKSKTAPSKDITIPRLAAKRGVLNTYQIVELKSRKEKSLVVDLGFRCYRDLPPELKLKKDDIARITGSDKLKFSAEALPKNLTQPRSVLFTYQAYLEKIIDGDTIKASMPLGFNVFKTQKMRLRKINAPEIDTKAGLLAKNFVENTLNSCEFFIIKTYSTDIYDRYLVDIFYLPGCLDPHQVAAEGIYLNQELINQGLAQFWQTPDPTELAFLN